MTFIHTAALVVFTLSSVQLVTAGARVLAPINLPSNFQYPNGITRASNGTLYVGSVTSGRILRINPKGKIETFFPGSDEVFAATSLRLDEQRGILWGTSPDFLGVRDPNGKTSRRPHRIFAIDTRTGKVLRVILMPDGGFGNDIALDANGGVYLTDSVRPRIYYLAPGADRLRVWAEDARFTSQEIGLSGIARRSDGVTIVGLFSTGQLFKVIQESQGEVKVEAIPLERKLENPDGMQFAPDGSLLVTEGAVASGNGRLLRIDALSTGAGPKLVETIASGMESPVNLTVADGEVWVTEARIRHRILPGQEKKVPNNFFIRRFKLPTNTATGSTV
ncbi:gluconolaconase [Scytonema sp. UIC 10036]|uniref:Vgb family protein n=1 Tax=Scytonema sp. UIC 10036 TaxID=2304196 RepID=UPI0012DAC661|nr:gluconolaconase [Scytonema sp. UIC 10036]MUG94579.1 gluconolaconase [Scytonema sp. UIC 10036]